MPCPICRRPPQDAYKPFCSRRCADVDLARWLREDYRIPLPPDEDAPEGGIDQTPDDTAAER